MEIKMKRTIVVKTLHEGKREPKEKYFEIHFTKKKHGP